jgi:predicted ATPase
VEGLAIVDDATKRARRVRDLWLFPELHRVRGELLARHGTQGGADAAEACFRQAIRISERQTALAWELRAGISLAGLLRDQGRPAEAVACLQPIHGRFTEGFDSIDLTSARALLDMLPRPPGQGCA